MNLEKEQTQTSTTSCKLHEKEIKKLQVSTGVICMYIPCNQTAHTSHREFPQGAAKKLPTIRLEQILEVPLLIAWSTILK